ncbi:MAG: DNRLRE domain-containing protein [Deltaproteobacteria bacterium]|nr:DNRLRE domain-containing protein [Deltaproteobacteria bacterium]
MVEIGLEKLSAVAIAGALVLALAGCDIATALLGGVGLPCDSDDSCAEGQLCIGRECRQTWACHADSECPGGYYCDSRRWTCKPTSTPPPDAAAADQLAHPDAASDRAVPSDAALDAGADDTCPADTAAASDGTPADSALPDNADPDSAVPDASVPDASVSDASVPDALVPDTACPGVLCDGGCFSTGTCCWNSDCRLPTSECTESHVCLGKVRLQQDVDGETGVRDTHLDKFFPDSNYKTSSMLSVRCVPDIGGCVVDKVALVKFRIPETFGGVSVSVNDARLALYPGSRSGSSWLEVSTYQILRDWDTSAATWDLATSLGHWSVAGCDGIGFDRSEVASDTVLLTATGQWFEWKITDLVQCWMDDPTTNHGVLLKPTAADDIVMYDLCSSDTGTIDHHPVLVIDFVER